MHTYIQTFTYMHACMPVSFKNVLEGAVEIISCIKS